MPARAAIGWAVAALLAALLAACSSDPPPPSHSYRMQDVRAEVGSDYAVDAATAGSSVAGTSLTLRISVLRMTGARILPVATIDRADGTVITCEVAHPAITRLTARRHSVFLLCDGQVDAADAHDPVHITDRH